MNLAKFTQMKDGDKEDYEFLDALEREYAAKVGERLLHALKDLDNSLSGYQVSRLEHSLQTATRAYYDGADIDWIVCALLHDIGDLYAPYNHDEYAAIILAPYVREQCTWVVAKHATFQSQYFAHHLGGNPAAREQYKGHPYFDDCDYFCENWDQASSNPEYPTLPLDFFEPMVMEVFSRSANDPKVLSTQIRVPLSCQDIASTRQASAL